MTQQERIVSQMLGDAWTAYLQLPKLCEDGVVDDDSNDFRKAIHDAQRIVAFRDHRRIRREEEIMEAKERETGSAF